MTDLDTRLSTAPALGISAPEVKTVRDLLQNKKTAGSERFFVCEGLWAAEKLVARKISVPQFFFCPEKIRSEEERAVCGMLLDYADTSYRISAKTCSKISERDGADGFFIVAEMPKYTLSDLTLKDNMVVMILDGQEQPGNIGAILRSLDCAGGSFAIMTNQRVKLTHPRLIRSSLGAAFMIPVAEAPMDQVFDWLAKNQFRAVLTDLTAVKSYREIDYSGRIAIVAGNEFKGISPAWRDQSFSVPVIIPMLGSCESLNVGFASTLVAYEAGLRQQELGFRSGAL